MVCLPVVDMMAGWLAQLDVDWAWVVGQALAGDGVDTQGQGLPLTQHPATVYPQHPLISSNKQYF